MAAYYNEIDPKAAAWLRELIKRGHIAPGDVDERSIVDVTAEDLKSYTQCHFFAGIGVWSYALRQAGWPDESPVWTGSCPCQPFSTAGRRGGTTDKRHLWPYLFVLLAECQPPVVFGEQVASPDGLKWFDAVSFDLESQDYAVGAADLCAAGIGAPHIRQRLYFVADTNGSRLALRDECGATSQTSASSAWSEFERVHAAGAWKEWDAKSPIRVFADRTPSGVGRLRGYGNAIVAPLATTFIQAYRDISAGTL